VHTEVYQINLITKGYIKNHHSEKIFCRGLMLILLYIYFKGVYRINFEDEVDSSAVPENNEVMSGVEQLAQIESVGCESWVDNDVTKICLSDGTNRTEIPDDCFKEDTEL